MGLAVYMAMNITPPASGVFPIGASTGAGASDRRVPVADVTGLQEIIDQKVQGTLAILPHGAQNANDGGERGHQLWTL